MGIKPGERYLGISYAGLRRIYGALFAVAIADGDIATTEREVLDCWRARFGLSETEVDRIEEKVREGGRVGLEDDADERDMARKGMLEVAAADHEIAPEEESLLIGIAQASDMTVEQLQRVLRWRGLSLSRGVLAGANITEKCHHCGQEVREAG